MQNAFGPFASLCQSQLAASRRLADAMFAGTEKIERAMIGATHRAVTEQLDLVQTLASSNDPSEFGSAFRSGLLAHNPGTALDYQKELMQIVSEVQGDIGRSFQDYVRDIGSHASYPDATPEAPQEPQEPAPTAANNAMLNPVTSMFSVWESAFKEVAALAKRNMMMAGPAQSEAARTLATTAAANAAAGAKSVSGTASEGLSTGVGHSVVDDRKEKNAHSGGNSRRK